MTGHPIPLIDPDGHPRTGPGHEHPATHIGCRTFRWFTLRWCKTHTRELVAADPDAAALHAQVGIGGLGAFMPPAIPTGQGIPVVCIAIDHDHAMTTDLDEPIIIAPLPPTPDGPPGSVVIDGWHRVYHALHRFQETLPAYVLTDATERAARFPLPYSPTHWR
ncbi:hypothetical protein [Actinokineospora inagensis]|uniref:hypothetical protein n=1 Tax=Actinokineospora inagensis TaxID=103730 RepID=UPI000427BA10|nr:hypothetical protein [Actinokineospora inagensis]